jgi:hypothetical protein
MADKKKNKANRKKKKFNKDLKSFQNKISSFQNDIWLPPAKIKFGSDIYLSDSFKTNLYQTTDAEDILYEPIKIPSGIEMTKSIKVQIFPTEWQRELLLNWIFHYTVMYNKTLKFIKDNKDKIDKHKRDIKEKRKKEKEDKKKIEDEKKKNKDKKEIKNFPVNRRISRAQVKYQKKKDQIEDNIDRKIKETKRNEKSEKKVIKKKSKKGKLEKKKTAKPIKKKINKILTIDNQLLRTYFLKDKRDKIQHCSGFTNVDNSEIRTHILDCAIKQACANYNSGATNFNNGRIKRFRVRYWRHNRQYQSMEIGKEYIKDNVFFGKLLGTFKGCYIVRGKKK